jgi:archaellum biogenesis ATPase FlaH
MAVNPHLEKIFFHNIINTPVYLESCNYRFFDNNILKKIIPAIKEFYEKYKQTPTLPQVRELIKIKNLDKDITIEQLDTVWDCNLKEYDDEWVKENTETFIEYKNLDISTMDLVDFLKTTIVNSENIKSVVQQAKSLIVDRNNLDFQFDEGSDFFDASKHKQPTYNTFSTGYNFMDKVADGGFSAKTLTVFLGQAKVGKSIWLGNIACNAVLQGHNVAVISLEMGEAKYIKRLGANLLNIKMDEYKKAATDTDYIKDKVNGLSGGGGLILPGQLIVKEFPTSTASSQDIESYLRRIEEKRGIKFKMVIIDYLNIMKNWRNANTENTYMKIKQIAEDVRAMAQRNNWAVVSVTQVKQSAFDSSDMNMGAASESSALVATVDLMFGIIQDPIMHLNRKYKLKVLANRDEGYKNCSKMFDIDYAHMRITEDNTPIIEGTE